jgi:hypothetical protein
MIIFGVFSVARGDTPKLFAPINHPLDAVTLTITDSIKRLTTALMGSAWADVDFGAEAALTAA